MANKKISELNEATSVNDNDVLPIVQSGETKKVSIETLNAGIIESGSNSNGNYIKYADGTMICTRKITTTINCSSIWGNLYYGKDENTYNYAQSFISIPILNMYLNTSTSTSFIPLSYTGQDITKNGFKRIEIARPTASSSVNVDAYVTAIGRWK